MTATNATDDLALRRYQRYLNRQHRAQGTGTASCSAQRKRGSGKPAELRLKLYLRTQLGRDMLESLYKGREVEDAELAQIRNRVRDRVRGGK